LICARPVKQDFGDQNMVGIPSITPRELALMMVPPREKLKA
jgi:hypothetical protein